MTSRPLPQCLFCAHLRPQSGQVDVPADAQTCDAFPDAIPAEILANRVDHRQPYEGDGGVQWEAAGDAVFPEYALNTGPDSFGEAVAGNSAPGSFRQAVARTRNLLADPPQLDREYRRDGDGRFSETGGDEDSGGALPVDVAATGEGGGHALAVIEDPDGEWGEPGQPKIAVYMIGDETPTWDRHAVDDSMVLDPATARGIADGLDQMADRADTYDPPTAVDGEQGPILIAAGGAAMHDTAAFWDANGDVVGPGERFVSVTVDVRRAQPDWEHVAGDDLLLNLRVGDARSMAAGLRTMAGQAEEAR